MLDALVDVLSRVALYVLAFCLSLYVVPQVILAFFCRTQNLKKKYNATWALVTGGSSGDLLDRTTFFPRDIFPAPASLTQALAAVQASASLSLGSSPPRASMSLL